jgi:hypothetical protein
MDQLFARLAKTLFRPEEWHTVVFQVPVGDRVWVSRRNQSVESDRQGLTTYNNVTCTVALKTMSFDQFFFSLLQVHEVDDCRFDVSLNDCAWYLRADTSATKNHWIDVIDSFKAESGYGSENNLKRNGSSLSLLSSNLSTMSPVFKKNKGLQDKLNELVTFRGILINQIDRLQMYFDTCLAEFASSNGNYKFTHKM